MAGLAIPFERPRLVGGLGLARLGPAARSKLILSRSAPPKCRLPCSAVTHGPLSETNSAECAALIGQPARGKTGRNGKRRQRGGFYNTSGFYLSCPIIAASGQRSQKNRRQLSFLLVALVISPSRVATRTEQRDKTTKELADICLHSKAKQPSRSTS